MKRKRRSSQRWVYLIGSSSARLVKIGVSRNPEGRLESMQAVSPVPLVLMWRTRGGLPLEAALHEYFSAYRAHGEWFDFGDEDPVGLVATASVLLGYRTLPEKPNPRAAVPFPSCNSCAVRTVKEAYSAELGKTDRLTVSEFTEFLAAERGTGTNRDRVLEALRNGASRNKEIEEVTGLNSGTVSSIVNKLVKDGVAIRQRRGPIRLVEKPVVAAPKPAPVLLTKGSQA